MTVLFLHGLEGNPLGAKFQYINAHLNNVHPIGWRSTNIQDSLAKIESRLASLKGSVTLVGSSFGAYLATRCTPDARYTYVLINPTGINGCFTDQVIAQFGKSLEPARIVSGQSVTVILSRYDDVVPPGPTAEAFQKTARIVWVDDNHRCSNETSLKTILKEVKASQQYNFLP